jgi:hypothetical protein
MVMVPSPFQVQVNLQVLLAILVVARELLIEVLPAMVQIQDEKELVVLGVVVNKGEKLMPFEGISTGKNIYGVYLPKIQATMLLALSKLFFSKETFSRVN